VAGREDETTLAMELVKAVEREPARVGKMVVVVVVVVVVMVATKEEESAAGMEEETVKMKTAVGLAAAMEVEPASARELVGTKTWTRSLQR